MIRLDFPKVRVDGVRCPDDPSVVLPLLLWRAAGGNSRIVWLWLTERMWQHHRGVAGCVSEAV